jgi:hypothetical protein
MDTDRLNRWLTLIANIGVVAGLILLVVEVRHAITVSESEAFRNRGNEIQEAMQELALSGELAEILAAANASDLDSLTPVQLVRLDAWTRATLYRMQSQFKDYHLGYLDEYSYHYMLQGASNLLPRCNELGIRIEENYDPEFIRAIREFASAGA